jgi:arylsulfatase A-like enzyme
MTTASEPQPEQRRPNIVLILVDDMGFSDIGCYGSEISTPNLDALAAGGLRFSQMYNCARCCPTRASLLTGLYPHQAGVGHMVGDGGTRAYQGYLRDDCVTVAEALGAGGYRTLMSGKWHVGGPYQGNRPDTWDPGSAGHPIPVQRGFDQHYGMLGGGGSYFRPPYMVRDDHLIETEGDDYYLTDAISDEATLMIETAAGEPEPFFLYVAYTAPHWPLHALPEDIARYRGEYRRPGWDGVRTARHEELKGQGILSPEWEITARDVSAQAWGDVEAKDWEDLRMAVYAAQVDRMDQGVGRITGKLQELGITEDTLVLFLSDNGGCAEFLAEESNLKQPFRYDTPTRDGRPMRIGNTPTIDPGAADTFASYDLPWANASNTPFRLYKHWVHEGGISTPLIAHWPNGISASGLAHQPRHVIDLMATCLDAAGVPHPGERHGVAVSSLEGESLLPAFQGRDRERERPIFWEHEGNSAVRDGIWKLVRRHPGPWELYNMERDRTETQDLATSEPGRVQAMVAMYDEWAQRCEVREWPLNRT